jgi:hypothetical protein
MILFLSFKTVAHIITSRIPSESPLIREQCIFLVLESRVPRGIYGSKLEGKSKKRLERIT